jgi:hypothetical protein
VLECVFEHVIWLVAEAEAAWSIVRAGLADQDREPWKLVPIWSRWLPRSWVNDAKARFSLANHALIITIFHIERRIPVYPSMGIRSMIMGRTGRYTTPVTHDLENEADRDLAEVVRRRAKGHISGRETRRHASDAALWH